MGDMNPARVPPILKPGDPWVEQSEPNQERKSRPKPKKKDAVLPVLIAEEEQEHQFDELA